MKICGKNATFLQLKTVTCNAEKSINRHLNPLDNNLIFEKSNQQKINPI
jgi:hypothetical protein